MFHVELAPLGGILGPLKSDLGVFWAKIPLYPYNVKFSNSIFSKSANLPILSFWILNLHIIICQFQKRSTVKHFFSLTPCSCHMCPPHPNPPSWNLQQSWMLLSALQPSSSAAFPKINNFSLRCKWWCLMVIVGELGINADIWQDFLKSLLPVKYAVKLTDTIQQYQTARYILL